MTTPASMSELSTTAASNNPAGSDAPSTIDDQIRALAAIVRQNVTKGSDIASASAITIPASGNYFVVTGTTGITSITDTNSWYGREVVLKFSGALTITHSANLILPGAANITTVSGDVACFVSESSGVWRCSSYTKYSGTYAVAGATTSSALTMATSRLLGRTTAGTGAIEEISVGSGLSLSAGSLSASLTDGTWTDYSATSTIVGWSSYTTKLIYYKDIGKTRFMYVNIDGTSNSTSTSFTLPSVCSNTINYGGQMRTDDNGNINMGHFTLASGASTVNCYYGVAAAAWTASGTKRLLGQFTYQLP